MSDSAAVMVKLRGLIQGEKEWVNGMGCVLYLLNLVSEDTLKCPALIHE